MSFSACGDFASLSSICISTVSMLRLIMVAVSWSSSLSVLRFAFSALVIFRLSFSRSLVSFASLGIMTFFFESTMAVSFL